jgi:cysteine desulfurase/selenocysteine lyase
MTVYLDNAATSFPKPQAVYRAVEHALVGIGATPGRGAHRMARDAESVVSAVRSKVAGLLGIPDPERVVFTHNATESINTVLKGWLRPGDRVLVSALEHNSVMRPLSRLAGTGVKVEMIACGSAGRMDLKAFENQLINPPRLVVVTHASNVNGALQPVAEIASLCEGRGVPLLLDGAQTAGLVPISVSEWSLGMFACSGHKALLGPPGTGILYVRPDLDVFPLVEGGTGSRSEDLLQPDSCPDRYESGTPNLPGIAGLSAGVDWILETGMSAIRDHEMALASILERELAGMKGVKVFRPHTRGTGVLSFIVDGMNPGDVAYLLDEGFDIAVRAGLHCAPLAHQTLGTYPEGTVRVSPGYSTSEDDIEYFLQSLRLLLSRR